MLYIEEDNTIRLTRGDTAWLTVPITNDVDGSIYTMDSGDTLTFTMRKTATATDILVQKISQGDNSFHILPEDTRNLRYGNYLYDVQLTTINGDIYTVVVPSTFEIMQEVTY